MCNGQRFHIESEVIIEFSKIIEMKSKTEPELPRR
jgi:hypothetical protein